MRKPQGVASLALGYALHWAFSPPLLNPKLQYKVLEALTNFPVNPPTYDIYAYELKGLRL